MISRTILEVMTSLCALFPLRLNLGTAKNKASGDKVPDSNNAAVTQTFPLTLRSACCSGQGVLGSPNN